MTTPRLALLLLALAACDDGAPAPAPAPASVTEPTGPAPAPTPAVGGIWAGAVAAEPIPGGVRIANGTTRPVGHFVIERAFAAVANWRPCVPPAACPSLAPGERRDLVGEAIVGLRPGAAEREAIVHWWHLVPDRDGALRPDSVRASVVRVGR